MPRRALRLPLLALLCALAVATGPSAHAAEPPAEQPKVVPPKLTRFVAAKVSPDAMEAVPEGVDTVEVTLVLTIGADGKVSEVAIRKGFSAAFDSAALQAASGFEFTPATVDGQPVPVKVPYTYAFEVVRRPKPPPPKPEPPPPPPGSTVSGKLLEKGSASPLVGETVVLLRGKETLQAVTDADGAFAFEGVAKGSWTLRVASNDFYPRQVRVKVTEGGGPVAVKDLYLAPKPVRRYRTVVKDPRPKDSASKIELADEEIKSVPGTFGEPSRVVATLPGVARSPFGLGYYVIRGADFANTGTLLDSFPSLLLYHFGGGPAVIHPELIGGVEFYPGGYPIEYGRFTAGLVNLESKDPPRDRWHLIVDLDLLKAGVLFSIPFDDGKGAITMALRRSYYELLLPLFVDDLMVSYWDYQFRVAYQAAPETNVTVFVLGSGDDLESKDTDETGKYEDQDAGSVLGFMFHRILTRVDHQIAPGVTLRSDTLLAYNVNDVKQSSIGSPVTRVKTDTFVGGQRFVYRNKLLECLELKAGLDFETFYLNADVSVPTLQPIGELPKPGFDPLVFNGTITEYQVTGGLFLGIDWEALLGLRLIPGVRVDWMMYNGRHNFTADPRLTARYTPEAADMITVKGNVGLYHQPPQIFQIDEDYGNPDLPPQGSVQSSLGVELRLDHGWELDVTGFYNHMFDLAVGSDAVKVEGEDVTRENFVAAGEGRAYGLEILIRKRFGDFVYGWLTYTLSRSERLKLDGSGYELFDFDQPHVLNLAWTFELGHDWSIGVRFRLGSGNPSRKVVGAQYDSDQDRYQPVYEGFTRLPLFHQLDLRVDKKFRFDTWMLLVYLDVQNVYYAENAEFFRYNYDFTERAEVGGLPIIPTLGVRAIF